MIGAIKANITNLDVVLYGCWSLMHLAASSPGVCAKIHAGMTHRPPRPSLAESGRHGGGRGAARERGREQGTWSHRIAGDGTGCVLRHLVLVG